MSDHRAIATVTAVLRDVLQEAANETVGGAAVTIKRPDARDEAHKDQPGINLFLYRVSENPVFRNADLPTRDASFELVERPQVGLDLDYLLTFYGAGLQPHLLLGRSLSRLTSKPLLFPDQIRDAIASAASFEGGGDLERSSLAQQLERVRVGPVSLSLEELSKLWSVFLQVPYDLSIALRASPILIEADLVPRAVPEVTERVVGVEPT
jgi:hypothetical protein